MKKILYKGFQKLKEYTDYLFYGEERKVHLLFNPREYTIGYLLTHCGLYKNCYRSFFSELDSILLIIQYSVVTLCIFTATYSNYTITEYFLSFIIITIAVLMELPLFLYQHKCLRFLLLPLANIATFITLTLIDCMKADVNVEQYSEILEELAKLFNINTFAVVVLLLLFTSIVIKLGYRRIFQEKLILALAAYGSLSMVSYFVKPIEEAVLSVFEKYKEYALRLGEIITKVYGGDFVWALIILYASIILLILMLAFPLLTDYVKLVGDYIILCYLDQGVREYWWLKKSLYEKDRRFQVIKYVNIPLDKVKTYVNRLFEDYKVSFYLAPAVFCDEDDLVIREINVDKKNKIVKIVISEHSLLKLVEENYTIDDMLEGIKEDIEWHIGRKPERRILTLFRVAPFFALYALALLTWSSYPIVSSIALVLGFILILLQPLYDKVLKKERREVAEKNEFLPKNNESNKEKFYWLSWLIFFIEFIIVISKIILRFRLPLITLGQAAATFLVNQLALLAFFLFTTSCVYLREW